MLWCWRKKCETVFFFFFCYPKFPVIWSYCLLARGSGRPEELGSRGSPKHIIPTFSTPCRLARCQHHAGENKSTLTFQVHDTHFVRKIVDFRSSAHFEVTVCWFFCDEEGACTWRNSAKQSKRANRPNSSSDHLPSMSFSFWPLLQVHVHFGTTPTLWPMQQGLVFQTGLWGSTLCSRMNSIVFKYSTLHSIFKEYCIRIQYSYSWILKSIGYRYWYHKVFKSILIWGMQQPNLGFFRAKNQITACWGLKKGATGAQMASKGGKLWILFDAL